MATTRIISMHVSHGKTIADCLTDRIDYSKNPEKTQGGELISAYECDPKTADAEFLYSKRQYQTVTGREQRHDVIAYQVRQSFKPGEITPEDANRVGAEGSHLFSFKGMAAGDGTIALSYERSWEQTDDDKKIVLQVKTGQNGAIESVSVG